MTPNRNLALRLMPEHRETTNTPNLRGADWARFYHKQFTGKPPSAWDVWYIQCEFAGIERLRGCIEIDPNRRGGVPVLRGTNFTLAQLLAELADTDGPDEIAENFDLDAELIRSILNGLSLVMQKPRPHDRFPVR